MPRFQRIPTGRTWRDLPPSPPASFVPAPVFEELDAAPETGRLRLWPFVAGGVVVVILGFIVGLMLPNDATAGTEDLGAPETDTTLPDVIVPPPPDLSDRTTTTAPGHTPAPAVDEIFRIPSPPEGWQVLSNFTQASSDRIDQIAILSNGLNEIRVAAFASATEPSLHSGEDVSVRGQTGALIREVEGRYTVTWIEPGKITFSIDAPDSFGLDEALSLAESLEVR